MHGGGLVDGLVYDSQLVLSFESFFNKFFLLPVASAQSESASVTGWTRSWCLERGRSRLDRARAICRYGLVLIPSRTDLDMPVSLALHWVRDKASFT